MFIVTNIEIAKTTASFSLFWLGTIPRDMAFFVTVVIGDLAKIFLFCTSKRFSITPGSLDTVFLILLFIVFSLVHLLFLLFPCLVGGFELLFDVAGLTLTLALRICISFLGFFRLFIVGLDSHLQKSLSLGTVLV